jgi:NADH-quinone oxidoreductase subunit J
LSNITVLALQLYTDYIYSFELAAVLLLIAIIAAITLVHRKEVKRKGQSIGRFINIQHLNNKQEQHHDCADIDQNQSNC